MRTSSAAAAAASARIARRSHPPPITPADLAKMLTRASSDRVPLVRCAASAAAAALGAHALSHPSPTVQAHLGLRQLAATIARGLSDTVLPVRAAYAERTADVRVSTEKMISTLSTG